MSGRAAGPWRTAIITGGASGIGHRLASVLAGRGVTVAVVDRAIPAELPRQLAVAGARGPHDVAPRCLEADVVDAGALDAAVAQIVEEIGPPDLVIHSAGISRNSLFVESSAEDFERTVQVNLVGSRNLAAAAVPHLRAGSRLAMIASLAGITGGYTYAAYASSKAGVIGLAKVLRLELAPRGIGVSVICPPEIMTPMVAQYDTTMHPATRALKDMAGTLPIEAACDEMLSQLAAGRFTVIPGRKARRTVRLARYLPERASQAIADRIVRDALASVPPPPREM